MDLITEFLFGPEAAWERALSILASIVTILGAFGVAKYLIARLRPSNPVPQPVIDVTPKPAEPPPPAGPWLFEPLPREAIGREAELGRTRDALTGQGGARIVSSAAILPGQGGIGKTTLARAYADRYRPDEIMVTGMIHDHALRLRSFALAAEALAGLVDEAAAA